MIKLIVKDMDIATGDVQIVLLNEKDARLWDLYHNDRLIIKSGRKSTTAVLDIAESSKAVPRGKIGCFEEVLDALRIKQGDAVTIHVPIRIDDHLAHCYASCGATILTIATIVIIIILKSILGVITLHVILFWVISFFPCSIVSCYCC